MFKQILAAVDLDNSDNAEKILQIAADIANIYSARLHVLSVIGAVQAVVSQHLPEGYEKMAMERTEQDLTTLSANVDLAQGEVTSSARFGDIYREILAQAVKSAVDLIIIGSNKPQTTDFLPGTHAARVLRPLALLDGRRDDLRTALPAQPPHGAVRRRADAGRPSGGHAAWLRAAGRRPGPARVAEWQTRRTNVRWGKPE